MRFLPVVAGLDVLVVTDLTMLSEYSIETGRCDHLFHPVIQLRLLFTGNQRFANPTLQWYHYSNSLPGEQSQDSML